MEREQIIKALECCSLGDCYPCPYSKWKAGCRDEMCGDALSLIKEITEENEYLKTTDIGDLKQEYDDLAKAMVESGDLIHRLVAKKAKLKEENERLKAQKYMAHPDGRIEMLPTVETVRADTVRKMHAEIVKRCIEGGIYPAFVASTIDQIAKEMVEDAE